MFQGTKMIIRVAALAAIGFALPFAPASASEAVGDHGPTADGGLPIDLERIAREPFADGIAVVKLRIDEAGHVRTDSVAIDASRTTVPASLSQAVVESAKTWRFSPAIEHGTPVASDLSYPIAFGERAGAAPPATYVVVKGSGAKATATSRDADVRVRDLHQRSDRLEQWSLQASRPPIKGMQASVPMK